MGNKNLIKLVVGSGVSLTLLAGVACGQPTEKTNMVDQQTPTSTTTFIPTDQTLEQVINWSFLEREIDIEVQPLDFIINNHVQLGPESPLRPDTAEYEEAINSVRRMLEEQVSKRGFNPLGVSYTVTDQLYAVPESQEFAIELRKYCRLAEDFLYKELKGLDKHNIEWTVINPNDNYADGFNGRGFIGKSLYTIKRIKVNKDNAPLFTLVSVKHFEGGEGKILNDNRFYLFVGSGSSALVSPFSEILPLNTSDKTLEYAKEVGGLYASQAHEALTEAIALSLAEKISKELNIPNGAKHVEDHYKELTKNPLYQYVPHARAWINRNGIQAAFDLYMKSPAEFMDRIGATKIK